MIKTGEAVIDERGNIRLLEPVRPGGVRRALVIVLDERPAERPAATALLSEAALAGDWECPEEDEAWKHLQEVQELSWGFPFSDLSTDKLRSAVLLADAGRGERVLFSGHLRALWRPGDALIDETAFASGTLRVTRYTCPGKTVHGEQESDDGRSRPAYTEARARIVDAAVALLRADIPPDSGHTKG